MTIQIPSRAGQTALVLFLLYSAPLLFLAAVAVASSRMDVDIGKFTRDPASVAQIDPFVGVVSNVGILLWTASSAICLFSWAVLRAQTANAQLRQFLLYFGLLTAMLLFDDFFLFHETVRLGGIYVDEKYIFVAYAGLVVVGALVFRSYILKTEYAILLVALVSFGSSLLIDLFQEGIQSYIGDWRVFWEDGFKLLGIVGWFGYFSRTCMAAFRD